MAQILFSVLRAVRRPMSALALGLLTGGLLTACAAEPAPRPMHVSARTAADSLALTVDHIPPGREITEIALLDPAGGETPARERELITREEASGGNAGPGIGVGATGGSSSGINPYISLGYLFRGSDDVRRSQRLIARIPLPDPAAYAADYRDWRIVVRYRDQLGERREVSIPAPPP
jgi:hypothetical protein